MRINLGSGSQKIEGFIGIDLCDEADLKHDLKKPLPFEDKSVEEIMAIHVIESFYKWEFLEVIKDWARVLKGKLTIEFTDLDTCCKMYLSDNEEDKKYGKWGFYGDQDKVCDPIVYHKYDYTIKELEDILKSVGFTVLEITKDGVQHNKKRDSRIICSI